MLANLNQHLITIKMVLAPLGVFALLYWASQEQSISFDANPLLLLVGSLLALTSMLPFALRFREVLKIVGFQVSVIDMTRILAQSMFYYFFVPLSVGTEVSKFAKLSNLDPQYPKTKLASAIALDHIVGLLVLLVISLGLYTALDPLVVRLNHIAFAVILIGCIVISVAAWFYLARARRLKIRQVPAMMYAHKKSLIAASCYSLVMHSAIAAAVFAGASLWQFDISYLQILFVLTGAFLFQMVPINLIGVSAIEIAGAGLYLAIGLSVTEALSLVSLLYCYRILIALIGGLWEFIDGWRAQQRKLSAH